MKHVKAIVAVCGICAAASLASASVVLPQGWDFTVEAGDLRGTSWSAAQNPHTYSVSTRVGENGSLIYRIIGAASHEGTDFTFDVEFDPDPFISSSFTVINNTGMLSPYTVTVTIPVMPPLFGPNTMTGSISGTVGDGDGLVDIYGNGGTVHTQMNGRPYYEAFIDGLSVRSLYAAPQLNAAPLNLTADIDTQNFIGEAAPAALMSMAIRNSFMLTDGDNASFTSTFIVVPSPAGVAALGLIGFAGLRRRR